MTTRYLSVSIFSLCICLMTFFQGCKQGYTYPSDLKQIDSLSEIYPDSALILLKKLSKTLGSRPQQEQMYAKLLTIKAKNYSFESLSEDTVIFDIIDYYKKNGDTRLLTQAYYYAGKIEKERLNIAQSMDCFFKVLELCGNEDLKTKSQTYTQLNYIYNQQWLDDDALSMCKAAHAISIMLKDTTKMIYELRDMGNIYHDLGFQDSSYACYHSAFDLAKKQKNEEMKATVAAQIARYYAAKKDYASAKKYLGIAQAYDDDSDKSSVLSIAADVYKGLGMTDSVIACYQQLYQIGTVYTKQEATLGLANFYSHTNDNNKEIRYFKEYEKYSDSIQKIETTQYVKQKKDIYEHNKKNEQIRNLEIRNKNKTIIIICLIFTLITIAGFSLLLYRNNKQRVKIRRINKERKRLATSALAFDETAETERIKEMREFPIFHRIENILNSNRSNIKLSQSEWKDLSEAVNRIWPEFRTRLYDLCNMSEYDYRLCLLIKIQIPIKDIATLTQKSKSGVVSVRTKLYQRAFNDKKGANDWDLIVHTL